MKNFILFASFFLCVISIFLYAQTHEPEKNLSDKPEFFIPKNHESNFFRLKKVSAKSFYERKGEWQHIIDTTWGPGDPLPKKLQIFNAYAQGVHNKFDGFNSLHLNWDSLYNFYLNKINDSTSKGSFSALMSHFAHSLKDLHTKVWDSTVVFTPLNPGIPILLLGSYLSVEHFGAVTTVLPDSTTLVLRVVPNHPLNLEPGDIILGYEGIPWKQLVKELFDAGLPMVAQTGGCKSANTYLNLFGAGLNWHLFNTIDILKHSTSNTVHLSVLPLLDLDVPPMANNEQLSIPNIPFPNTFSDECVTYGKLENSNVGYIYLAQEWPENAADAPFYNALNSLKNTDGIIIDMRLNRGGWGFFPEAFNILFNQYLQTVEDAYRCNSSSYGLCPSGDSYYFQINGTPQDFHDRPIAVLLGPTCVSMGDLTALRLGYHPMVRFFGASSDASHGDNLFIRNYQGWYLRYSISDVFHTNNPNIYLNRREFPIDFPVWHTKEDVVNGKDAVVEKALEWINNLVYGHDLKKNTDYCRPGTDTLKISALVETPNRHQTSAKIYIKNLEGSFLDSLQLTKSGLSGKSEIWVGNYSTDSEDFFSISLSVEDITAFKTWTTNNISRFATAGPLTLDSVSFNKILSNYGFRPFVHNEGSSFTITNAKLRLICNDPWVKAISTGNYALPDIAPDSSVGLSTWIYASVIDSIFPEYFNLIAEMSIDGWIYWEDSLRINTVTGIEEEKLLAIEFKLEQNYPNPFNPTTTIGYVLQQKSNAKLTLLNALGEEISVLVNEEQDKGYHKVELDGSKLTSGVYFYQLKAGSFIDTKKMILLK